MAPTRLFHHMQALMRHEKAPATRYEGRKGGKWKAQETYGLRPQPSSEPLAGTNFKPDGHY